MWVIALASAAVTWAVTGEIIRAVTILVVFCPCALVLATPTAIMAAIGNATRHGFLVREGDALERLAQVTRAAFDKTGTLTYGKPQVTQVELLDSGYSREQLYAWAAGGEARSEHPLGKAIVRCYQEEFHTQPPQPDSFQMLPGRGVKAQVQGVKVMAGNRELLERGGRLPDPAGRTGGPGGAGPGLHPGLPGGGGTFGRPFGPWRTPFGPTRPKPSPR